MRWDLLDKFDVLKKGSHSHARKFFSGEEDFFKEHFPGNPRVPGPLLVEMVAQAGGVLFGLGLDFAKEVILAKIGHAHFSGEAKPPCTLRVEAKLEEQREDAAWVSGVVRDEQGRQLADVKILLVSVDSLDNKKKIVFNDGFLKHFDVFNVARASEELV